MAILKKNKKSHLKKKMFFDEGVDIARYDQVKYPQIEKITDIELDFIGINNRNLRTLKTDINHCLAIRDKYHNELNNFKIIAESGFKSKMELENYKSNGIELFLIGESILKEKL